MTEIKHLAWYTLIIANIYGSAGQSVPFALFLVISILCFVASRLECDS